MSLFVHVIGHNVCALIAGCDPLAGFETFTSCTMKYQPSRGKQVRRVQLTELLQHAAKP
jgi:hypothetical protein